MLGCQAPVSRALFTCAAPSPLMKTVMKTCTDIMQRHRSGATEAFYQRMLAAELYHRGIPCLTEVEVFTMSGSVPVLVGRLDMEVDHSIILELKAAPAITPRHVQQLMKYVRARTSTGMSVVEAAVVCFTERDTVDFKYVPRIRAGSPFFSLKDGEQSRRNATSMGERQGRGPNKTE